MTSRDAVVDGFLWTLCVLCLGAILWGSLAAPPQALVSFPHADKLFHFSSYFTFVGLFLLTAVWRPGRGAGAYPTSGKIAIAGAIVLGALLEIAQGLLLERQSDLVDALANLVGAFSGAAAWRVLSLRGG